MLSDGCCVIEIVTSERKAYAVGLCAFVKGQRAYFCSLSLLLVCILFPKGSRTIVPSGSSRSSSSSTTAAVVAVIIVIAKVEHH